MPSLELAPVLELEAPITESWEDDRDTGEVKLSPEDLARLRLESGSNTFAITSKADLKMLLSVAEKTGRLVVVDYYVPFCRVCRQLLHYLDRIAQDAEFHEILFASVNYKESGDLCNFQDVRKFPTVEIYRGSELRQRWAGSSKRRLLQRLRMEMEDAFAVAA